MQNKILKYFIAFLALTSLTRAIKSKYSENANKRFESKSDSKDFTKLMQLKTPFRMQKFNIFWENVKGTEHLHSDQLMQLYMELGAHDEKEIELKHIRGDGGDVDGELEAQLRTSFIDIMHRFELKQHLTPDLESQYDDKPDLNKMLKEEVKLKSRHEFENEKLKKLMNEAKNSKEFDGKEIESLKTEFVHFEDKRNEEEMLMHHNMDMEKIQKKGQRNKNAKDPAENSGENIDAQLHSGPGDVRSGKVEGFHHPKVQHLWIRAMKTNFTTDDLEDLKGELKHFEHKLYKHEAVSEQVELLQSAKTSNIQNQKNEVKEVKDKENELRAKVKKWETHLENRISNGRTEL